MKKNISSLSQTDWDEIDLIVKIANGILETIQTNEIIQTENGSFKYLKKTTKTITK